VVDEIPQSRESIRGRDRCLRFKQEYLGMPEHASTATSRALAVACCCLADPEGWPHSSRSTGCSRLAADGITTATTGHAGQQHARAATSSGTARSRSGRNSLHTDVPCDAFDLHAIKGGKTGDQDQKRRCTMDVSCANESELLPSLRSHLRFLPIESEPCVSTLSVACWLRSRCLDQQTVDEQAGLDTARRVD
jgi:hypothetical protein